MINNDNAMSVLNNFNTLLTKSITQYANKHEINAVLCAKGLTLLGCGAHKVVYKYQNAAVGFIKCSLSKRKRMAVNIAKMKELKFLRGIFLYPYIFKYDEELDLVLFCMPLCRQDMFFYLFDDIRNCKHKTIVTKKAARISKLFAKGDFLYHLTTQVCQYHIPEDDNRGIFNFDIKFENIFLGKDVLFLGDIDGFGHGARFGTHTDSWCISLYGGEGSDDQIVFNKRLGCINDLYNILLIIMYLYVLDDNYQSFLKYFREMEFKSVEILKNGIFKNSKDCEDKVKNLQFVKKKLQVFNYLLMKFFPEKRKDEIGFINVVKIINETAACNFLVTDSFLNFYVRLKTIILKCIQHFSETYGVGKMQLFNNKRRRIDARIRSSD